MRWWKRVVVGLCVLTVAAIALIRWGNRGGREPRLSVSFLGYTNRVHTDHDGFTARLAYLSASNSGPFTLKVDSVYASTWTTNFDTSRSWLPVSYSSGRILKPGQVLDFQVWVGPRFDLLGGRVVFEPYGIRERAYDWGRSNTNSTIQRWSARLLPGSKTYFGEIGPFTNEPPASVPVQRAE